MPSFAEILIREDTTAFPQSTLHPLNLIKNEPVLKLYHTRSVNDYPIPYPHRQQRHTAANFAALHHGNIWLPTSPNRLSTPYEGKGMNCGSMFLFGSSSDHVGWGNER
ncbi:hypothetical protein CDAR_234281 [Caerostris darwini]|uniref:Ycf15 n=1 Tax=Caerostris darwini TaxID=1538125 RepID=A0AAV4QJF4_9ARAC|nr:hypothetical protein CDAR_234281 [Caerostris darwini]